MRSVNTYKWLEKKNDDAIFIFPVLGLGHPDNFPRFRDCNLVNDGKEIEVWSRMGAKNAKCWEKTIYGKKPKNCDCAACWLRKVLKTHPNYLRRRKWKEDSTYVAHYFSVPEGSFADIQYLRIGHHRYTSTEYKQLILSVVEDARKEEITKILYPTSEVKSEIFKNKSDV